MRLSTLLASVLVHFYDCNKLQRVDYEEADSGHSAGGQKYHGILAGSWLGHILVEAPCFWGLCVRKEKWPLQQMGD